MKHIIYLIYFLPLTLTAQITQTLGTESLTFSGQLDLAADEMILEERSDSDGGLIEKAEVEVQGGDLYVNYQLNPKGRRGEYSTRITYIIDGQRIEPKPQEVISPELASPQARYSRQTILLDLRRWTAKSKVPMEIEIEVILSRQLIDCAVEPTFTFRQQLPFSLSGLAGVGMLATGLSLVNDAERTYTDEYQLQSSAEAARPILDDLNRKNQTGVVLTYAGAAILLGDAVWYWLRRSKYQKNKTLYEQNCGNETSLRWKPNLDLPTASFGWQLTYTF